jgi:hypothetical protein
MTSDQRRRKLAVAGLVFSLVVPATYCLERVYEWSRGETGDPRLVLRTLHTVYFWRAGIAFWWGIAVAVVVLSLRGGSAANEERTSRILGLAAVALVPAVVLFAFLVP